LRFFLQGWDATDTAYRAFFPDDVERPPPSRTGREKDGVPLRHPPKATTLNAKRPAFSVTE